MSGQRANLKRRGRTWVLRMSHLGTRHQVIFSTHIKLYEPTRVHPETRGAAEQLGDEIAIAIRNGAYPPQAAAPQAAAPVAGLTFTAAATRYVDEVVEPSEMLRSTVAKVKARFTRYGRTVLPALGLAGELPLVALTKLPAEALYRLTVKGDSPSNKRKYRQALVNLFDWAVATGALLTNPIPAGRRDRKKSLPAGKEVPRTRRVYAAEEANLLQAASEARQGEAATRLVSFLVLAFDCGLRLGELLALRWDDVRWDEGPYGRLFVAALEEGARKGGEGKSRRVPLTPRARRVLEELQTSPLGKPWPGSAYVCGTATGARVKQIRKAWVTTALRSVNHEPVWLTERKANGKKSNGLAPESQAAFAQLALHEHDIRHECALRWLKSGVQGAPDAQPLTLGAIAKLLGHNDLSTLRVYLGLTEEDALREAEGGAADDDQAPAGPVAVHLRRHDGTVVLIDVARQTLQPKPQTGTKRVQTGPRAVLRVVGGKGA